MTPWGCRSLGNILKVKVAQRGERAQRPGVKPWLYKPARRRSEWRGKKKRGLDSLTALAEARFQERKIIKGTLLGSHGSQGRQGGKKVNGGDVLIAYPSNKGLQYGTCEKKEGAGSVGRAAPCKPPVGWSPESAAKFKTFSVVDALGYR